MLRNAMARDALNFFLPFRRLEPNHENQLTRALLVVLRLSPIAHSSWLRLVAPDRRIEQFPSASFDTQVRAVRHAASETIGANAYLAVSDDETRVELSLYPADTLSQARAFYRSAAVEHLLVLADEPDWELAPNFHFGHFQRGYCWTTTTRDTRDYVELWRQRIDDEGEIPRERWNDYWEWLETERIATPEDRDEFDLHFTQTQRQKAFPRPGLRLARRWPLADAEKLDSRNALADAVRTALNKALTASGEPLLAGSLEPDAHATTPRP